MMIVLRPVPLLLAALLSSPAFAQSDAPPQTLRLSDTEKAALLARNTEASVDAARAGQLDGAGHPDRQIHGEIGAAIGTHGARAAYGTAAIPLGDHAGAIVSFESSRWGHPR